MALMTDELCRMLNCQCTKHYQNIKTTLDVALTNLVDKFHCEIRSHFTVKLSALVGYFSSHDAF